MSKKNIIFLLGLVLYLNLFFFHALGFFGFNLILWGIFIFFLCLSWPKNKISVFLATVGLIVVSIITITRANLFVSMLFSLTGLGLIGLFITLVKDKIVFVRSLFEFVILPFNFVFSYLESAFELIIKATTSPKKVPGKLNITPFVIGLIISLPIIAILLGLFSSADPAYQSFLKNISNNLNKIFQGLSWQKLIDRVILSLVAGLIFSPFIYFFSKKKSITFPRKLTSFSFTSEATIVMLLLSITVLSFILIQWPYIFARVPFETDLSKFGVATYSEYVKKGFSELILVSLIVYCLMWFSFLVLRAKGLGKRPLLFYLQMSVFAEFLLVVASIFRRVYLYQSYHGWTIGRIYGSFFLLWILIITLALLLRHFIKAKWVFLEVGATGILILVLGLFNAEDFIVKNHPPTVNKKIDYIYLSRMSPDGYLGWKSAYNYAQDILLNRQPENKEIINREERREIAYAGMIVNRLTIKYDQLLFKYAPYNEQKEYYQLVLNNQLNNLDFCFDADTKNKQELIIKKLTSLEDPSVSLEEISKGLHLPLWFSYYLSFNSQDCATLYFYDIATNYTFSKSSYTDFDKFLSWNYTEDKVYKQMKNDMNIKNLLELQNRFRFLFKKIANQPDGEREFDFDVSVRSPFL